MLCMLSLTCMDNDKELREEDDRQEESEVGEDKHLCSIFNLHAGKCPATPFNTLQHQSWWIISGE